MCSQSDDEFQAPRSRSFFWLLELSGLRLVAWERTMRTILPRRALDHVQRSKKCMANSTPPHGSYLGPSPNMFQIAYKHFQQALTKWPKDRLRPESQLQDVLARRIDRQAAERKAGTATGSALSEEAELKQVNATYSLLEDRYKTKVRTVPCRYRKNPSPDRSCSTVSWAL